MIESHQQKTLEPAQALAAHTLDRHISVIAGPGAGKTLVLVERYLHILRERKPSSIDQIVAITFTNRAANEMRERLRKSLDVLLAKSMGEERERWRRYKRTLDGAVITTIHGFCMRLLREFPVEAGLDPQFMLLDEHRAATLLAAAVEESLTESISRREDSIVRLTAGIGRPMLATALFEIYLKVRGHGLSFDDVLKRTIESHSAPQDYESLCDELDVRIAELTSMRGLTSRAHEKTTIIRNYWPRVRAILRSAQTSLPDYCGAIAEFREAARPDARGHVATVIKQLDELFWGESKEKCFGRLPQMRFDLLGKDYAVALVKLLKTIDRRFTENKQELAALDFDDLQVRAFELLQRPEVLHRASQRYRYFLVDEFQDTNGLQRNLLEALALNPSARANLFIVGDRKQSVYGFRGADVDVFARMTDVLETAGGDVIPLPLNFRSQPPLINFFNFLFARFFQPRDVSKEDQAEVGFVAHELSVGKREARDAPPLVELMVDRLSGEEDPRISQISNLKSQSQTARERDARQLVQRIISLTDTFEYRDIALLFRAMTDVPVYEGEFRRAGIPFQTVLGKGFYEREEITDLIQLCRFLDNQTDELALAAVLRSPLCGISDNTLLALRLAPNIGETASGDAPQPRKHPRPLFQALRRQSEIDFIDDDEREALKTAAKFLSSLVEHRNRYPIRELLRFAIKESAFTTVIAATFDGAQRLANVDKLFNLAERFERSGAHLIRDFVKYVRDFETIGSRESEGQLDDSANAVKLMTIHQAKGLEFPVVIIPDLHRTKASWDGYFLLDRHRGLTLKVPDGRGQMVSGRTFAAFNERSRLREDFESMRLLYVAATRARDRLILSGATRDSSRLVKGDDSWLQLIWQALELGERSQNGLVELDGETAIQLTFNATEPGAQRPGDLPVPGAQQPCDDLPREPDLTGSLRSPFCFPLLSPIQTSADAAVHRFSVTQLINYQRCPRQYYFDRIAHVPSVDELAVWNHAEAPEPPANLTATLKGAVIHRFCETYCVGDDTQERLAQSLADVIRVRQARLADRVLDINSEEALKELWPLAESYLSSKLFQRVEAARRQSQISDSQISNLNCEMSDLTRQKSNLKSEISFRLRRPLGILTGTIDKLIVTPSSAGNGFDVEVIDFKTNRFTTPPHTVVLPKHPVSAELPSNKVQASVRSRYQAAAAQMQFDFSAVFEVETQQSKPTLARYGTDPDPRGATDLDTLSIDAQEKQIASDYQLQMQAYALAVRELMQGLPINKLTATLHFLHPNIEHQLQEDLLTQEACAEALDQAMLRIISSHEPSEFPVRPATHCRMCNFLTICPPGRQSLSSRTITTEELR